MLESLGTVPSIKCKYDELFGMIVLQLFRNTPREVIKAALVATVRIKMLYRKYKRHYGDNLILVMYFGKVAKLDLIHDYLQRVEALEG